jgi:catechol 2,3-dioxygenase-like lactoylglutathione lyase family enzyme
MICPAASRTSLKVIDAVRVLHKLGMNHICFAVDDIEAEVGKLKSHGFKTRNEIMDFHSRKLVFIDGPEGVTIELSQWH